MDGFFWISIALGPAASGDEEISVLEYVIRHSHFHEKFLVRHIPNCSRRFFEL